MCGPPPQIPLDTAQAGGDNINNALKATSYIMWAYTQNNPVFNMSINPKGRPRKRKIVQEQPRTDHFSPRGRPGRPDEVIVTVEEYEAFRLADYNDMSQKDAAKLMGISQQSFSRIVRRARKLIADALVNAKVIHIEGGDYINKRSLDLLNKLKRKSQ
jgi:predicted DNA-binding protein (UPF0251 family)